MLTARDKRAKLKIKNAKLKVRINIGINNFEFFTMNF